MDMWEILIATCQAVKGRLLSTPSKVLGIKGEWKLFQKPKFILHNKKEK